MFVSKTCSAGNIFIFGLPELSSSKLCGVLSTVLKILPGTSPVRSTGTQLRGTVAVLVQYY